MVRVDPSGDGTGWRALHGLPVVPGFTLVVDDLDPYRWPNGGEVETRMTLQQRRTWQSRLNGAWRILADNHWTVAEEVTAAIRVLTPIKQPIFGQKSASASETFGTIALSAPRHSLGFAATFAHEIQHAKLRALTDMVALTRPDDGRRYYAPWRPDPRPAYGLLQGVYAFLGVADFWRRQIGAERGPRRSGDRSNWSGGVRGLTWSPARSWRAGA
nr:hypothetical protein GCM10020093_013630 [Planobispora longispora]